MAMHVELQWGEVRVRADAQQDIAEYSCMPSQEALKAEAVSGACEVRLGKVGAGCRLERCSWCAVDALLKQTAGSAKDCQCRGFQVWEHVLQGFLQLGYSMWREVVWTGRLRHLWCWSGPAQLNFVFQDVVALIDQQSQFHPYAPPSCHLRH